MKCFECESEMTLEIANRAYDAADLNDVWLCSIEVRRCPTCHNEEVAIPAISALHALLAKEFVRAHEMLPARMRFVRKQMGYSRLRAADLFGVTDAEVERVESGTAPIPEEWLHALRKVATDGAQITDFGTLPPSPSSRLRPPDTSVKLRYNHGWSREHSAPL